MPNTIPRSELDSWLLSGVPVVRLRHKDYDAETSSFVSFIREAAKAYRLNVVTKVLPDPEGVVVQCYVPGAQKPVLLDPLLKVTKTGMPWLYCETASCKNRVGTPGERCAAHV